MKPIRICEFKAVSYTHLDVYKRQMLFMVGGLCRTGIIKNRKRAVQKVEGLIDEYSRGGAYLRQYPCLLYTSFFVAARGNFVLDQEFLDAVKAKMREYVERKIPIMKRSVSTDCLLYTSRCV